MILTPHPVVGVSVQLIDHKQSNFDSIYSNFRWNIPQNLNIAHQVCERHQADADRIKAKLGNANFVDRAPEAVVNKEREKLAEAESALNSLHIQAEKIRAL